MGAPFDLGKYSVQFSIKSSELEKPINITYDFVISKKTKEKLGKVHKN
jgi:hypothetical protein